MDAFIFSGGLYESFCTTQFKKNRNNNIKKRLGKNIIVAAGIYQSVPGFGELIAAGIISRM